MHAHRLSALAAMALLASVASPVVTGTAPVSAHTGPPYTSITDNGGADISPAPTINGTTMQVRILRPSTAAPAGGWPLVVYMAGDLKNRCANINENATRASWYTRKQMAEHGFAVLSFNARGLPAQYNAGVNPTGTSGCTTLDDAKDAIDDSGWDLGGTNDKADIKGLIDWAVANYNPTGCATTGGACIDGDKVGLFGFGSVQGLTSLLMGVPNPPNAQHSSRVKGIVSVGYEEWAVRDLTALSSDGAGNWREVDQGIRPWLPDMHRGDWSHADPSVLSNTSEFLADKYLNTAVPGNVASWLDERTVVHDNPSIDKAQEITTPVFLADAFLDDGAGASMTTLAYNKLGSTSKYLYLGACGSAYGQLASTASGPCKDTNATNLQNKVHAFLDRHVKGDTLTTVGGPVWWSVPPGVDPLGTGNWGEASDAIAAWPPSTNPLDAYTIEYCLDGAGEWHSSLCSAVTDGTGADLQDTNDRTISNVVGASNTNPHAFCTGATYGSSEVVSYTSGVDNTADYKMIGFEADLWMKSDLTRLQVYADLFTVDGAGVETRVTQGGGSIVPVKRDGTANTLYRFRFKPVGAAWTLRAGHSVRLKIAANYKKAFAQEFVPTNAIVIKHTDANPLTFRITFDF
ncbi:MAG TPA: CocE/NonD family hydrolase [Acidimicrobiales bacterium]|nr:CocE/NonD family hydrolase [Acidimicrobiales bacterium]